MLPSFILLPWLKWWISTHVLRYFNVEMLHITFWSIHHGPPSKLCIVLRPVLWQIIKIQFILSTQNKSELLLFEVHTRDKVPINLFCNSTAQSRCVLIYLLSNNNPSFPQIKPRGSREAKCNYKWSLETHLICIPPPEVNYNPPQLVVRTMWINGKLCTTSLVLFSF